MARKTAESQEVAVTYVTDAYFTTKGVSQVPRKDYTLPQLTALANELHAKVESGKRTTLIAAKDCGATLLLCKEKAGHGNWKAWLKENFTASADTAQLYKKIARDWHLLDGNGWLAAPELPGIAMAENIIREIKSHQKAIAAPKESPAPKAAPASKTGEKPKPAKAKVKEKVQPNDDRRYYAGVILKKHKAYLTKLMADLRFMENLNFGPMKCNATYKMTCELEELYILNGGEKNPQESVEILNEGIQFLRGYLDGEKAQKGEGK